MATLDRYRDLENQIASAESKGLRARWEFGKELMKERRPKQLPKGRVAEIEQATGVARREIQRRMQFAEKFSTEEALARLIQDHLDWADVRESLPAPVPGPEEVISPDLTEDWIRARKELLELHQSLQAKIDRAKKKPGVEEDPDLDPELVEAVEHLLKVIEEDVHLYWEAMTKSSQEDEDGER